MKKKVMISSIGSPAGISVVKLIDKAKYEVHGVNSSIPHVNESLVDFFHLVPRINDVNYIEEIKKLVLTHDIDIFVPTIQPDLNKVKELREFVDVLTVSNDVLNLLLDKELMYEFFEVNGLSSIVPKYRRINRNNYIKLDQLFDKPYILKPTKEHGGQGFKSLIVEEEEKLTPHILKGDFKYRTFYDLQLIMKSISSKDLIISEVLNEPEISVDCLFLNNDKPIIIPRKRVKTSGGIVVEGELTNDQEIIDIVKEIGKKMSLSNFINIQFMYDNKSKPKVIDINPRFCGSFIMSYGGGVNFVNLSLDNFFGQEILRPKINWDVKFTRFWSEVFHD